MGIVGKMYEDSHTYLMIILLHSSFSLSPFFCFSFLAATGQLHKRVCRSIGRLVGRSVRFSFFKLQTSISQLLMVVLGCALDMILL